jgi:HK97 family phage major capsid protein
MTYTNPAGGAACDESGGDCPLERYLGVHAGKPRTELAARREQVITRTAELEGYARRSQAQDGELSDLIAEQIAIDDLIKRADVEIRRAEIDRIREIAKDPANLEVGGGGQAPGFVPDMRSGRLEPAQQVIARSGNPWADGDTSGAGYVARAHTALETLGERLGHDGAELLAQAITERLTLPGITVKRSKDETAEAAALILALSNPYYESAMRSVIRNPDMFAAGMGHMVWSDDERQAMHDVMVNTLCRAAFAESSGAAGAFALPLQLDPSIILTNSGVAGPHRQLARTVIGTSNVWEGVSSAGVTSAWIAEGGVAGDNTPTLAQIAITPYKQMSWAFGSFEVMDDTELAAQMPALFADGKTRLETTAFTVGTGSAQPYGVVTRAASDASTGVLANTHVYGLHGNLPPRFRSMPGARPAWLANVSIMDAARQLIKGTGMTESIVDDSGDVPRMLGIPFYEASAMSGAGTSNKVLLLGDFTQMIIVDRLPGVILAEPLVKDSATQRPTGQRGWLHWSRVGSDITTAGAAYGSNAFVVHTQ